MATRVDFIDLAKGFCIILVVLSHVCGSTAWYFLDVMNIFRMPLYFVLSGLFFKSYGSFFVFVKKKTNKLLIPFLSVYLFVVLPSSFLIYHRYGSVDNIYDFFFAHFGRLYLGIDGAAWFLLCLFFMNLIFYLIYLIAKGKMFPMFLMTIACGLTGYLLDCQHIYIALWIDSALTAMPFFMLGYFIRSKTDLLNETLSKKHLQLSVLSLLMLLFAVWLDEIQGVHEIYYGSNEYEVNAFSLYAGGAFGMHYCIFKLWIIDFLGACSGGYLCYALCNYIENRTVRAKDLLTTIGYYSFVIYAFHAIEYVFPDWHQIASFSDGTALRPFVILICRLLLAVVFVLMTIKCKFLKNMFFPSFSRNICQNSK